MARDRQQESEDTAIDLTPMLDVVFIMLIFFIVTTSFVKEAGVTVEAPFAEEATPKKHASIFIGVTEQGDIWLDKRKVELKDVRRIVERMHRENTEGEVVIQADAKSRAGVMVDVLDQAKAAGVKKVSVAARVD